PTHPQLVILAQSVLEESWRKRELVARAVEAHPDDAWLLVTRLEQLLSGAVYDRADEANELLTRLQSAHPDSVRVQILAIQHMALDQLDDAAYEAARELAKSNWRTPLAVDEL